MTREKAKKILEAYIACESKKAHFECDDYNCDDNCPLLYEMGTVGEHNEAINMAIQALEQEPCEDAISREDVINLKWRGEASEEFLEGYANAIEDARVLPSVKPQTGHWIEHPEIKTSTPEYLMFYECSECGDKQCFCKSDIQKKHFCNNCGARMVEPQESEDKE